MFLREPRLPKLKTTVKNNRTRDGDAVSTYWSLHTGAGVRVRCVSRRGSVADVVQRAASHSSHVRAQGLHFILIVGVHELQSI